MTTNETPKLYRVDGFIITQGTNCWNVTVSGSNNLMTYDASLRIQDVVNLLTRITHRPQSKRELFIQEANVSRQNKLRHT